MCARVDRGTRLEGRTYDERARGGTSNIEKKVIKKAVHTPFIEVYQNLNSGTRRLNGLKLSPVEVGNKGPSPSGSIWGERNPMKLFSRKIPKPYVTMNHPCIIYTLRP